jgi:uncharacterized membrane protein required for colicin V production
VLDLIIILILLGNVAMGFWFGLLRRVMAFIGLFAGLGAATLTSANTSTYLMSTFGWTSVLWAHVVTYSAMVLFGVLLFEVLGAVYQRWLDALIAPLFDRVTGMLAGAVVGALEVTVILIVGIGLVNSALPSGYTYPPAFLTAQDWFRSSALAPHFYGLEPLTKTIFAMVLPGSISSYFSQLLTTNH